ncbi:MAG: hypothetical protein JNJ53_14960 [Rhizobiales bacterium]|nr:hypothetical protein [Hyphomicrobiales bacterium]
MGRTSRRISRLIGTVGLLGIVALAAVLAVTILKTNGSRKPISDSVLISRLDAARGDYDKLVSRDRDFNPPLWRVWRGSSDTLPKDLREDFKRIVVNSLPDLDGVEIIGTDLADTPFPTLAFVHDSAGMSFSSGWLKGLLQARDPLPAAMTVDDTDRAFESWLQNEHRSPVLKVVRPLGNGWYVFLDANDG